VKKLFFHLGQYLKKSDTFLLVLCILASSYGILLIRSATRYQGTSKYVYIQTLAMLLGIALYFLFSVIDVDIIAAKWRPLLIISLALIASLFVFGKSAEGNRAWLRFGGIGIQPAEVGKIIFIVVLAHLMDRCEEARGLSSPISVLVLLFIFLLYFGLIVVASSDLGSALVYLFIFITMLFAGGLKLYWFLIGIGALAAATPYLWEHFLTETQKARILAPYDPTVDPTGLGITWQTNRSRMALASGRIFGSGLYHGAQTQAGSIPKQWTDFIYSVAGEELGLVGCALVILLLVLMIVRCIHVGLHSQSRLGALVCFGVAGMLIFQTFENIGMCIGIAPVVGLTLPFFSYGGSSLVTMFAAMGVVSGVKMKPKPTMFLQW